MSIFEVYHLKWHIAHGRARFELEITRQMAMLHPYDCCRIKMGIVIIFISKTCNHHRSYFIWQVLAATFRACDLRHNRYVLRRHPQTVALDLSEAKKINPKCWPWLQLVVLLNTCLGILGNLQCFGLKIFFGIQCYNLLCEAKRCDFSDFILEMGEDININSEQIHTHFMRNYHSFNHKSNIAYNDLMKSSECIKSLHEEEINIFTSSYRIGRKRWLKGKGSHFLLHEEGAYSPIAWQHDGGRV